VVLEITDGGTGLVPTPTDGRSASTKRPAGVGLGLGIAQAVVDRHRGAINMAPAEGGGTKVTVMVPTTKTKAIHDRA
jgi:two-component system, CitB family, sensor kinase